MIIFIFALLYTLILITNPSLVISSAMYVSIALITISFFLILKTKVGQFSGAIESSWAKKKMILHMATIVIFTVILIYTYSMI